MTGTKKFIPTSTDYNGNCRNTRCTAGQSAFDAIREGIDDGWYPGTATLGPRATEPKPANAIAQVTVRSRESYWILA